MPLAKSSDGVHTVFPERRLHLGELRRLQAAATIDLEHDAIDAGNR